MKELVVISGKGGTGKTSITAAFAALAREVVLADCDVDAADLHLVLEPSVKQVSDFSGGKQAVIDAGKCIGCGRCEEMCRFDAIRYNGTGNTMAIKTYVVDPVSCEGCKVCVEFCPPRPSPSTMRSTVSGSSQRRGSDRWFMRNWVLLRRTAANW